MEKRARARFSRVRGRFPRGEETTLNTIQHDIEEHLAATEPQVEVLLAEVVRGATVRLFIDHPDGVDLDLCERVTHQLAHLREHYALEVSSPGPARPLSKPAHYQRFLGHRARVRTREPIGGHRSFTGELVGASDDRVTIAADSGVIAIPYADVTRSNLVEE